MSHINIWIHIVWTTNCRRPFLTDNIRSKIFNHIKENAKKKKIHLDHINGYLEHIHCLISLNADQNIMTIANLLKGESSYWINKQNLMPNHFSWQDDYFAESVSPLYLDKVRKYIRNQEEHHRKITFQEEFKELAKRNGLNEKYFF